MPPHRPVSPAHGLTDAYTSMEKKYGFCLLTTTAMASRRSPHSWRFEDLECHIALGGRQAIAGALAWAPHVIVMDISMPECNGIQAARAIREDDATADMAIIAFTALDEREVQRRATDRISTRTAKKGKQPPISCGSSRTWRLDPEDLCGAIHLSGGLLWSTSRKRNQGEPSAECRVDRKERARRNVSLESRGHPLGNHVVVDHVCRGRGHSGGSDDACRRCATAKQHFEEGSPEHTRAQMNQGARTRQAHARALVEKRFGRPDAVRDCVHRCDRARSIVHCLARSDCCGGDSGSCAGRKCASQQTCNFHRLFPIVSTCHARTVLDATISERGPHGLNPAGHATQKPRRKKTAPSRSSSSKHSNG